MTEYVELHCHSNYSLLDGAAHPEAFVEQAAMLGMPALALTDHDAIYGAVPFVQAAAKYGIQPILGAELTLDSGAHLTLLVQNAVGWQNLCWLITQARLNAPKGEAALPFEKIGGRTDGLIALSGCRQGELVQALLREDTADAMRVAENYRALFGADRFWIELQHHLLPGDSRLLMQQVALAQRLGIGYVATNNVHYPKREQHKLQDVLVCIRHQATLEESTTLRRPNSEYYLKTAQQLRPLFAPYPAALTNSQVIAEQCQFELAYGLQDLPTFATPDGMASTAYLAWLCEQGLRERYGETPSAVVQHLAYELAVIDRAGLSNYFLVVWDIVRFARQNGIRCQGRGSAANSLVAYLLGISPVDPLAHDLVFERFLSDERQLTPDIDIDFDAARREEVIQYVYKTYGAEHTAMACTLVTFRSRSAVRDVGKALGLSSTLINQVTGALDWRRGMAGQAEAVQEVLGKKSDGVQVRQLLALCEQIQHFPRHLGIHNGGMIVMNNPIAERVPLEPATMPGRVVLQWDKEQLETIGLVKIDILGLRMLSVLSETVALADEQIDLDRLPFDDPAVYKMITAADTIGVFQVESRAQSQLLPRLKPCTFADLIVAISLIRPGPVQGNMVHPYVSRRAGLAPVMYPHPLLKGALGETLGVILFQEQVLKVARDFAGFTAGQGELLRRALGAKRKAGLLEELRTAFIAGAQAKGVAQKTAETVFASLEAFGGYSFPKSHAAAFAVIVYQSAWLKHYYPAAFYAALLNNQPMGFWSPSVIVNDARRHGVPVLPVHLDYSQAKCALEGDGIRLGFNQVKGFGEASTAWVVAVRETGAFMNLNDFCQRTHLPRRLVENLILVGALDHWALPRRNLLWELKKLRYPVEELELVFEGDGIEFPPIPRMEQFELEFQLTGISTGTHVMEFYRERLRKQQILDSRQLNKAKHDAKVKVAGLVVVHQAPPTAKGFHFITLEDEGGLMDIIIRPDLYERCAPILRQSALLMVQGVVQRGEGVINVIVEQVAILSEQSI